MSRFPTSEADGAISNKLTEIYHQVARELEQLEQSELPVAGTNIRDYPVYIERLAIYVQLSLREVDKFYGVKVRK